MAVTDVTIASRALNLIGANEIASFDEASNEAKVAKNLYEPIVEAALTRTRWRFATGQQTLIMLADTPESRWDSAYQMPTSPQVLLLHGLTIMDKPIQYDRYEDKIYANTTADDVVTADYTYKVDVIYWPSYFTKAVMFDLAAMFAGSLAQKGELATHYTNSAELAYRNARWADSSSQTARNLRTSTLTNIRRR
tara:strand:- start:794 stop:1375 length:582 start_codon:yes stop_codon:yes gene_type:complete